MAPAKIQNLPTHVPKMWPSSHVGAAENSCPRSRSYEYFPRQTRKCVAYDLPLFPTGTCTGYERPRQQIDEHPSAPKRNISNNFRAVRCHMGLGSMMMAGANLALTSPSGATSTGAPRDCTRVRRNTSGHPLPPQTSAEHVAHQSAARQNVRSTAAINVNISCPHCRIIEAQSSHLSKVTGLPSTAPTSACHIICILRSIYRSVAACGHCLPAPTPSLGSTSPWHFLRCTETVGFLHSRSLAASGHCLSAWQPLLGDLSAREIRAPRSLRVLSARVDYLFSCISRSIAEREHCPPAGYLPLRVPSVASGGGK